MKTQSVSLIAVVTLGAALAACGPREKPLPPDLTTTLQQRYNESDAQGAAALFTDDGAIMSEFGEVVVGKAAIAEFFRSELDKKLQYWVTSERSAVVGDLGYDYGQMRVRDTAKGQDLENAKYMTLFRKEGGSWKIHRTIYNTNSLAVCTSVQVTPAEEGGDKVTP